MMKMQNYEAEKQALKELIHEQKREMSKDVFESLDRLLQMAEEQDDREMKGFAHYHIADALFSFEIDYSDFRQHLAQAIYSLGLVGEKELLARAYNLVAIDAINNGSYDVAYLYLMNAMQTCEGLDDKYLLSIINNNIGQVYGRMRSYEKGVVYVRLSNELQGQCSQDDYYYHDNMINGYFAEGAMCALMEDLEGAREADERIARLEKERNDSDNTAVLIPISLLRLMIAILEGDEARCRIHSRDFTAKLQEGHRIYDYILDIEDLCFMLIDRGYLDTVGEILDIIRHTVEATNVVQMKKVITGIEIAYYEKKGDVKRANHCLRKQYYLSLQQQMEQNRIYEYSIDLINIMDEQRKEQEKVRMENRYLQSQVLTDPLTSIPNRLMLDRSLSEQFEEAKRESLSFGVALMDINKFKGYNDNYGHLAGDLCLQKVAQTIQRVSEKSGVTCARFGGDEFIMLYVDKSDEEILAIAEELNEEVRRLEIEHFILGSKECISLSQGICNCIPREDHSKEDYINEADNALYAVKKTLDRPGKKHSIRLVHL